uniref:Putative serine/threonine-protein kinase pakg n=1 Tax=Lutzomyia longipalpis TaxID=7200 RepID=A0A1B0CDU9_LUTLO
MIITHQIISTLSTLMAFTTFIGSTWGIRVDWNTNTGPIVPPTTTKRPVPQYPYRNPAPVWEDQSNDVPNPNPYVYVLPPPSRPRYNNNTYQQRSTERPQGTTQAPNYGTILSPHHNEISRDDQYVKPVAHLAVQYVPNVGFKYYAVIAYNPYVKQSKNIYDKPNGKYNAKLKKYKAYEEKAKFTPYLMYIPVPPPQQQQVPPYGFVSQKAQVSKS